MLYEVSKATDLFITLPPLGDALEGLVADKVGSGTVGLTRPSILV